MKTPIPTIHSFSNDRYHVMYVLKKTPPTKWDHVKILHHSLPADASRETMNSLKSQILRKEKDENKYPSEHRATK